MKSELAIYGGEPIRNKRLNYGKQYIDQNDIEAVCAVLKSDYLTCGPEIPHMEHKLCEVTGAKFAVAVSNGTAALHIACLAAGIGKGDEVIVSSITFAASANCILYCGATPVFADIDHDTWNISIANVEQKITSKTKAIIAVDFMGQAAALNELKEICLKHELLLIEDAAHSINTRYDGNNVGSIADITTFSFHPVKTITAGEGGAVLTNDIALYRKAILYRAHGITRDENLLTDKSNGNWYYEQQLLGYNYRITDIQAALCCSQLDKLDAFSCRRKEIVAFYNQEFKNINEIILPKEINQSDTTRHLYIIYLKLELLTTDRKTIYEALQAENIGVNVHYIPVYRLPYYQSLGYPKGLCPNAEDFYERCITLPLFYSMTDDDAWDVVCGVRKVINYFRK
ncbi:UDP-4-amino-4,6-dideoxy-N-acetyl-beta-L-altrosamine transaminase [Paludicola sp. MB14-C6]|uniref:UDP-4-amino-4, 6-dideoxy-N-acetyl-beta-L-altrosamine transaminase n=1 Tax=Paludihabitans sp. MB14-C6 TaxID=3070656 RepID=UPI0035A3CBB1